MSISEQSRQLKETIIRALQTADAQVVTRISVPAPSVNALAWLEAQAFATKCYVAKPDGSAEMASAGVADQITAAGFANAVTEAKPVLDARDDNVKYFGGLAFFNDDVAEEWASFGPSFFFLPRFELHREGDGSCTLIINVVVRDEGRRNAALDAAVHDVETLSFPVSHQPDPPRFPATRTGDAPSLDAWRAGVGRILQQISSGSLEKAVFARRTSLQLHAPVTATELLRALRSHSPDCFHFLLQVKPEAAFIGATPEMLFYRRHRLITSQAIAATRPRSPEPSVDARFENELIGSEKERREHAVVARTIRRRLMPICSHIQFDGPVRVLKLSRVQHLSQSVAGVLHDEVDDAAILQTLHPTPAVGGSPNEAAIEFLHELEPFDRGWYAAPLGWLGKHSSGFAVGIRSALLRHDQVNLYAGAGIVEGSDADREWAELESKIANFLNCFEGV